MHKFFPIILGLLLACSSLAQANSFGVADSRAQALGGTAVALGGADHGFYYNPALVAMHQGDEDLTRDGRLSFALIVDGLSNGAQTAAEAITDDLEGQVSDAIAALNNNTNVATARYAIVTVQDLGRSMRELERQNIYADLYTGLSVSEPGDREGGAFYIGSRLIAVGDSTIEQADLDLLDDYLEALTYIESFGSEGVQHPELLDENGAFNNPSDDILSSASGSALLVTEAGLSAASQITIWGQDFAFGVTPKVVYLRSFDERWGINDGDFNNQSADDKLLFVNFDAGLLWSYQERWRIGLAVKDAIAKHWQTKLGQSFELNPKARLGLAYWGEYLRIGLDADLDKADHLHRDASIQMISMGIEWQIIPSIALRAGYRQDLEETLGNSSSIGVAWRLKRLSTELSYSSGDLDVGAAFQLSWYL